MNINSQADIILFVTQSSNGKKRVTEPPKNLCVGG